MDNLQPKTVEEMIMANNAYIQNIFHQITQVHVEILLLCQNIIKGDDWPIIVDAQADSTTRRNYRRVANLYEELKMNHVK